MCALARVKTWGAETLTDEDLNAEFDNILNNALSLISPLTGNLAFGGFRATGLHLGTAGSPAVQFTGDTNTGVYSPAADQIALAVGGANAVSCTSTVTTVAGNLVIGGLFQGGKVYTGTIAVANNGVSALSAGTAVTNGMVVVLNGGSGRSAIFELEGSLNTVAEALDVSTTFSHTKDNAATTNVYYDSGYKIQNLTGSDTTYTIIGFGS